MKNVGASMKVFVPAKVKRAVVFTLISFAFVSPAFAVLRPLFPAKPVSPVSGEIAVIGDDFVLGVQKPGNNDDNQMKWQLIPPSKRIQSEASVCSLTR
jgi:hypothetical protein